jgi:septal ring-binding cell division protein DamX
VSATDAPPPGPPPPAGAPEATVCPRCGAPVRPDQDWCLNCGTAVSTEVAGAPGWRTPVAIVGVVLLIAAAALVFAFLQISDDAEREAQAPTPTAAPAAPTTPTPAATPTAEPTASPVPTPPTTPGAGVVPTPGTSPTPGASPTPAPGGGAVGTWPEGRDAWTVVLFSSTRRAEADGKAKEFADQGKAVGVLDSDEYASLRGGYWVVFSGQYDGQEEAQSAAEGFGSTAPGAYARRITPR